MKVIKFINFVCSLPIVMIPMIAHGETLTCRVQSGGVLKNFKIIDEEPCRKVEKGCLTIKGITGCFINYLWPSGAKTVVGYKSKNYAIPVTINGQKAIYPNAVADHNCVLNTKSNNLFCVGENLNSATVSSVADKIGNSSKANSCSALPTIPEFLKHACNIEALAKRLVSEGMLVTLDYDFIVNDPLKKEAYRVERSVRESKEAKHFWNHMRFFQTSAFDDDFLISLGLRFQNKGSVKRSGQYSFDRNLNLEFATIKVDGNFDKVGLIKSAVKQIGNGKINSANNYIEWNCKKEIYASCQNLSLYVGSGGLASNPGYSMQLGPTNAIYNRKLQKLNGSRVFLKRLKAKYGEPVKF